MSNEQVESYGQIECEKAKDPCDNDYGGFSKLTNEDIEKLVDFHCTKSGDAFAVARLREAQKKMNAKS
jgi:hypothetical protein